MLLHSYGGNYTVLQYLPSKEAVQLQQLDKATYGKLIQFLFKPIPTLNGALSELIIYPQANRLFSLQVPSLVQSEITAKSGNKRKMAKLVTSNGKIYFCGGEPMSNRGLVYYDIHKADFVQKASMKEERLSNHCLTELRDQQLIVTGGVKYSPLTKTTTILKSCEVYSVATNKWVTIASLNELRNSHTAFSFLNGTVYVLGQNNTYSRNIKIEKIKLDKHFGGSWALVNIKGINLLTTGTNVGCARISLSKVMLFGGWSVFGNTDPYLKDCLIFDEEKQEINAMNCSLTKPDYGFTECRVHKGKFYTVSRQRNTHVYNERSNRWRMIENTTA